MTTITVPASTATLAANLHPHAPVISTEAAVTVFLPNLTLVGLRSAS